MKKVRLFTLLILVAGSILAQENPITTKFYGYIASEFIYDTYRSVDSRDGELYFFPKEPRLDINGVDINKRSKFNLIALQSRFGFRITGPDVFGAKASGNLEMDFFATQQSYVRLLRMRLANILLKWEKTEMLTGLAFHPAFVLDCSPSTISFAAAAPFHPLNRSAQLRLTQNVNKDFSASVAFLVHGYHISSGPTDAQRNSGLPETVVQLRYGNSGNILVGVTGGYKFLSPRDITAGNVATTKTVGAYNLQAFSRFKATPVTIKLEAMVGENMTHFVMPGGYGAKGEHSIQNPFDWSSDYDYANLRTMTLWADLHSDNKVLQWGLFAGYLEMLGSKDPYLRIPDLQFYDNIHSVFRISPRLTYFNNNFSLGFEYAYYSAVYGETFDKFRKALTKKDPAINNHIIVLAKYSF